LSDTRIQTADSPLAGPLRNPFRTINPLRSFLRQLMSRCEIGRLTVESPDGSRLTVQGAGAGPEAILILKRWRAMRRLLTRGDIGFAESYIDGDWTSPDLASLIELAARNVEAIDRDITPGFPTRLINRFIHLLRDNSRSGSRRNIVAHYDLGNAFYGRWLDAGLSYSSALYTAPIQSLEEAQAAKQDLIIDQLDVRGGERVLEIGCGWGGLAERLIREGCHVTGLTLSPAQLDYTNARLSQAALGEGADIRLEDYRDTSGQFDRIVSIEMFEAVGRAYWPTYFATLRDRLAPGGTAVLQVITIDERRFESYARNVDFIQRYVFPGGMLPSRRHLEAGIAGAGLCLRSARTFGDSYARTLEDWHSRFQQGWSDIQAQGFSTSFKRVWEYYLAYCEAGFRAGTIDVGLYRVTHAADGAAA
jgi:cyclopropane-fatty-acyl-phospholipid synthase